MRIRKRATKIHNLNFLCSAERRELLDHSNQKLLKQTLQPNEAAVLKL